MTNLNLLGILRLPPNASAAQITARTNELINSPSTDAATRSYLKSLDESALVEYDFDNVENAESGQQSTEANQQNAGSDQQITREEFVETAVLPSSLQGVDPGILFDHLATDGEGSVFILSSEVNELINALTQDEIGDLITQTNEANNTQQQPTTPTEATSITTPTETAEVDDTPEVNKPNKTRRTGGSGGGGGGGNDYSANSPSDNAPVSQTPAAAADTIESLQAEKTKLEQDKQQELQNINQINSGSTPELTALKGEIDKAQQELDTATANETPEVKAMKADLDTANSQLSSKNTELGETNTKISGTTSDIGQTKGSLSSLQGALNGLAQPSGAEGDEARDAALKERRNQLTSEIKEKQGELDKLESTLSELNTTKGTIEGEIQALNETISNLETEMMKQGSEATQTALTNLKTAKESFEKAKSDALPAAQSKLDNVTNQINEVTTKITELENKKVDLHSKKGIYESMGLDQKGLNFDVFSDALEGYNNLKDKGNGMLAIFDTTQAANKERYYLLDMNTGKLVEQSTMKTGKGNMGNIKTANRSGSGATLSGFEKIGEEYYSSKMGKMARRIIGLEPGINDQSINKGTVFHYTNYNSTLGCLGFPPVKNSNGSVNTAATNDRMRKLAPTGTIVYVHPTDPRYKDMSALL